MFSEAGPQQQACPFQLKHPTIAGRGPMGIKAFSEKLDSLPHQSVLSFQAEFADIAPAVDIEDMLLAELQRCKNDFKHPPRMRAARAVNLFAGKWHHIDIMVFEDTDFINPLTTHPADTVFHFLSPAEYTLHRLNDYDNAVFNPQARAVFEHRASVEAGAGLAVDATRGILSFRSLKPIVTLCLSNRRMLPFSWDFDLASGVPQCHYNNYALPTILELMAKLIGSYGDEASVPGLKTLLRHASDTIKWQAAYALIRVEPTEGIAAFEQLANSSNPALATAAKATLEQCRELA